jgi:hypothetical protein
MDARDEFLELRGRDGARDEGLVPGTNAGDNVLCIPVAIAVVREDGSSSEGGESVVHI